MRLAEKPFSKIINIPAGAIQTIQLRDSSGVLQYWNHIEVFPTDPAFAGTYFVTPSASDRQIYSHPTFQASDATLAGSGAGGYVGAGNRTIVMDLAKPNVAQALRISNYSVAAINLLINYCNRTVANPVAERIALPQGN